MSRTSAPGSRHLDLEDASTLLKSGAPSLGDPSLTWVVLPQLAMLLVGAEPQRQGAPMRNLARGVVSRLGPSMTNVDGVGFLTTSVQHRKVLEPVARELGRVTGCPPQPVRLPRLEVTEARRAWSRANRLHRSLQTWASSNDVALPRPVGDMLIQSSLLLARSERATTLNSFVRTLVVATQHNSAERAALQAARAGGVTTVYVPHAPVANNSMYADVPTHWAILRGQAEVDWYRRLGAGAAMGVGGDPSVAFGEPSGTRDSNHIVYAASDPATVQEDLQLIRSSGIENVTYCPHPRFKPTDSDRAGLPSTWRVSDATSTFEELRSRGALAVVQRGSGVGLEALGLGISVIDVRPPGCSPNYPYLESPLVHAVHDSAGLTDAVARIRETETEADRRLRDEYALSWRACSGPQACSEIAAQLARLSRANPPRGVVLDGWAFTPI